MRAQTKQVIDQIYGGDAAEALHDAEILIKSSVKPEPWVEDLAGPVSLGYKDPLPHYARR